MRSRLPFRTASGLLILLGLLAGCNAPGGGAGGGPSGAAPAGDYGDAPDNGGPTGYAGPFAQSGQFPSLFASDGARTLVADEATLGPSASIELDANDTNDPDGTPNLTNSDSDDGLVDFFITLTAIPPPTTLTVNVSAPAGSPGGAFFLNAIIDLNMDGEWGGQAANGELEWVVQNQPVQVAPGSTTPFTSPPFAFSNGNLLPDGAFMRLALTKEMVPANWDGRGEFSAGEIEDHFIKLPDFGDKDPPPIITVDCNGPYQPGQVVNCTVTNLRPVAGTFTYSLRRTGTGTVNVPIATCVSPGGEPPGGPVAIGPSGVVVITCNSLPGGAPDTWRFTARVQDPEAVVVEGGIRLGHSDESTSDFAFEGQAKAWDVYVGGLLGSYVHFDTFSRVLGSVYVYGDDPVPMERATVTLRMTRPDGSSETKTTVTGLDGAAMVEFDIFVYGNYTIAVENIEGEFMSYAPDMNVLTTVEVGVGPGESTPVGTMGLAEPQDETEDTQTQTDEALLAFIDGFNTAFENQDVDALFNSLHPAALDLYGSGACRTYLEGVIDTLIQVEVLEVTEFGLWQWQRDGRSTEIENVYTVQINLTAQGETSQIETHYGLREDGSINWFTDCGEPLE